MTILCLFPLKRSEQVPSIANQRVVDRAAIYGMMAAMLIAKFNCTMQWEKSSDTETKN